MLKLHTLPATAIKRPHHGQAANRRSFEWPDRVVLRRGPKMMVLFRGCPCQTEVDNLRHADVTLGLALSSGELPSVRSLDDYAYVFVSSRRRTRSTLGEAIADLERNSWTVEDNATVAADEPRPVRSAVAFRRNANNVVMATTPIPVSH